ncbi:hypothetical protein BGX24_004476 [Mortierella sp. AD032]|nr:hypothetical protein BGX24_004476 [Mortierella sp. AD032]
MPTYTFSEDREFHASSVAFSPTSLQIAAGKTNNTIRLYDPQAGKLVKTMALETYSSRALCYSPSGHQLAIGTDVNVILLWDLESEKPSLELRGHRSPIACIAYSPCGQWIASGSEDETIHLWRKKKRAGEEEEWSFVYAVYGFFHTVVSVVWNPAVPMEFVSGCSDGSVRVWHVSVGDDDRRDSESEKDYDEDRVKVSMQWGSNLGRLCAMDLVSTNASGLCSTLRKLLLQKGAVDDSPPSPAPTGAVGAVGAVGESEP